jgi:C4-dicarboxylate-specific signal transduction histidine kinase
MEPSLTETTQLSDAQLTQINRLATIARFVSSLAHELNNSLQVMSGLIELLGERDDLPADVVARLERLGMQADHAGEKIKQVVGYVREPDTPGERVDLGTVVDRALALRSYELGRAGVAVAWSVPADRFVVRGSSRALQQIVLNLLANAGEALAGAPVRELRVELTRAPGRVRLVVADNGPGVPPHQRDRIFDPFFTTRGDSGALGLGLTIAGRTAAACGGRLFLEPESRGAMFVLELPAVLDQDVSS